MNLDNALDRSLINSDQGQFFALVGVCWCWGLAWGGAFLQPPTSAASAVSLYRGRYLDRCNQPSSCSSDSILILVPKVHGASSSHHRCLFGEFGSDITFPLFSCPRPRTHNAVIRPNSKISRAQLSTTALGLLISTSWQLWDTRILNSRVHTYAQWLSQNRAAIFLMAIAELDAGHLESQTTSHYLANGLATSVGTTSFLSRAIIFFLRAMAKPTRAAWTGPSISNSTTEDSVYPFRGAEQDSGKYIIEGEAAIRQLSGFTAWRVYAAIISHQSSSTNSSFTISRAARISGKVHSHQPTMFSTKNATFQAWGSVDVRLWVMKAGPRRKAVIGVMDIFIVG